MRTDTHEVLRTVLAVVCAHVEPYPLSFLAFHCFQAVLPNTSFPLFPTPRCVSTDTRQAEERSATVLVEASIFPVPLTRLLDCRDQPLPSLSGNLQRVLFGPVRAGST